MMMMAPFCSPGRFLLPPRELLALWDGHKKEHMNDITRALDKQENYRTSDLYYAAYLKVAGIQFKGTQREGNRIFFLFEASDNLKDLRVQYFNSSSKVAAMPFADSIKAMKSLTHDGE
jgi:hypothetical protein